MGGGGYGVTAIYRLHGTAVGYEARTARQWLLQAAKNISHVAHSVLYFKGQKKDSHA